MNDSPEPTTPLRIAETSELSGALLEEIRALLVAGFEEGFSDDDWEHTIGGHHFIVESGGSVVGHASVVPRVLEVDGRPLRAGYVEGVATPRAQRRRGLASLAMAAASDHIRARYEIGGLGTDLFDFYRRFGWERWAGPTYVRRRDGLFHSEEEDGYVMVLRFGPSAKVDLTSAISCDERSGDDW